MAPGRHSDEPEEVRGHARVVSPPLELLESHRCRRPRHPRQRPELRHPRATRDPRLAKHDRSPPQRGPRRDQDAVEASAGDADDDLWAEAHEGVDAGAVADLELLELVGPRAVDDGVHVPSGAEAAEEQVLEPPRMSFPSTELS
eukprot:1339844-Rhodomonas_salina.1